MSKKWIILIPHKFWIPVDWLSNTSLPNYQEVSALICGSDKRFFSSREQFQVYPIP